MIYIIYIYSISVDIGYFPFYSSDELQTLQNSSLSARSTAQPEVGDLAQLLRSNCNAMSGLGNTLSHYAAMFTMLLTDMNSQNRSKRTARMITNIIELCEGNQSRPHNSAQNKMKGEVPGTSVVLPSLFVSLHRWTAKLSALGLSPCQNMIGWSDGLRGFELSSSQRRCSTWGLLMPHGNIIQHGRCRWTISLAYLLLFGALDYFCTSYSTYSKTETCADTCLQKRKFHPKFAKGNHFMD
jgi:hypothetical protein